MDARILGAIASWHLDDAEFERLALDIFAHQVRFNESYALFAASLGFDERRLPPTWRDIPAVPSLAFKEAAMTTFDPSLAVVAFETSGTTRGESGRHLFEASSLRLYDAALLAAFDRFMLGDAPAPLRYLLLVPQRRSSSLGYMMQLVAHERGDGCTANYVDASGDELDVDRFVHDSSRAFADGVPVCIAGTAFAFVALLEGLRGRPLPACAGSRIMETGGFKGRTRIVERKDLYAALSRCFDIRADAIVAEYGMTELTSQYYDAPADRRREARRKTGPPWLRPLVVDGAGKPVATGETGILRHVDLANRGSVLAIETEDLAVREDGGFVLLGRDAAARLRGCSLDAEDLIARRR